MELKMDNPEIVKHVRGESEFIDDLNKPQDILYGTVFASPIAHGNIKSIDTSRAMSVNGVVRIIGHHDIPGENQIGAVIKDEELLAEGEVRFAGEPVLLILSNDPDSGREAVKRIKIDFESLKAVTDPREAYAAGNLVSPVRTFILGDMESAWGKCAFIVEGRADSAGQEHYYMETQGAMAYPSENDGVRIISSTQSPTAVQRAASVALGIPMNRVEVDVRRLGGAFGGKEDQATPWAVMAALGAFLTRRPVRIVLSRHEDIRYTGKRHPFSSDFKIGLDREGKILAYEAVLYQNCGACADLSTAIMERALFHSTNSYFIPNVKVTGISSYTHLPPFTAFRGFGAPQAMFVIESAIRKAASVSGIDTRVIQKMNLLKEGDIFPYGMKAEQCNIRKSWDTLEKKFDLEETFRSVRDFNRKNEMVKKGAAVMPVTFGISFTNKTLNQAGALVHIYTDGSVSVSTGAVEMGQGVNKKIRNIAAETLGIPFDLVRLESTNTTRVANTSPTAASSGADLNGMAAETACRGLRERLYRVAASMMGTEPEKIAISDGAAICIGRGGSVPWKELVNTAYLERVSLSCQAYYATPDIHFDRKTEKGKPFAYHVYGTALVESELDVLRGTYRFEKVSIVHDNGRSIDPVTDLGQVEGGVIQGLGWMTIEELIFDANGILVTGSSSTYKVPDIKFIPEEISVEFLPDLDNPYAVRGSKAVGEPPLMYGIGGYFAVLNALEAAVPGADLRFDSPITPEKSLKLLGN